MSCRKTTQSDWNHLYTLCTYVCGKVMGSLMSRESGGAEKTRGRTRAWKTETGLERLEVGPGR